ncbi:MAG: PD-(D/E)XK nuclease domain-containing protein [Deltaproteobacteria bacterium]|jgi:hypothetical protein|nr:PD-(D/E)XK nuclease domain-containing protein [Deltaproteobacteria bacterium]
MIDSRLTVEELNDEIGLGYHGRLSRGELDVSAPRGALYRAGILALKTIFPPYSPNRWIHVCRYSNQEACEKLSRLWIAKFFKSGKEEGQALGRLRSAFASRDPGAVAKALNYFLARNPYDRHLSARSEKGGAPEGESQEGESQEGKSQEGKSQEGAEIPIRQQERFIRSSLLTILKAAGLEAQADIHEYLDRSELMVKADGLIWVFELEICQKEGEQEKTAEAALAKIQEKGLPEWLEYPSRAELFLAPTFDSTVPFWGDSQRAAGAEWTRVGRRWRPEPSEEASLLMGMAISREKRTIAAWKTEGGEPSQKPAQAPISG